MIPCSGLGTDAYDMFAKGCRTGTSMRKASHISPTVYRGLISIYARIKANLLTGNASTRMPYFGTHVYTCVELILPKGVMCVRTYIRMLVLILPKGEQHRAVPTHTHG